MKFVLFVVSHKQPSVVNVVFVCVVIVILYIFVPGKDISIMVVASYIMELTYAKRDIWKSILPVNSF